MDHSTPYSPKVKGYTEIPSTRRIHSKTEFCRQLIQRLVPGKALEVEFPDPWVAEQYRSTFYTLATTDPTCPGLSISRQGSNLLIWIKETYPPIDIPSDLPEAFHG